MVFGAQVEFSAGFGRVFSARLPRVTLRQCTRESAWRWGTSVVVTTPQPAPTRGFMVGVIGRLVVVAGVITRRDLAARCTIFRGLLGVCNPGGTALRPAMGPHDGAGSPTDAVAAVRAQPRIDSKFATCNRSVRPRDAIVARNRVPKSCFPGTARQTAHTCMMFDTMGRS